MRRKVVATVDDSIEEAGAEVTAFLKDGRTERVVIEHAIGSLEQPLTDEQLEAKFRDLAEPVIGSDAAGRLIQACRQLGGAADVGALIAAARPAA